MMNSSRVSILPVWKKLENKKESDLPNLSCTIKCGNIALWKGLEQEVTNFSVSLMMLEQLASILNLENLLGSFLL